MLKEKIKFTLSTLSYLWILFAVPILFLALTPQWYYINYGLQDNSQLLNSTTQITQTNNLVGFFTYKQTLNSKWSITESQHMADVRVLYSLLFLGILGFGILLNFTLKKEYILGITKITYGILLLLLPIMFVFSWFWDNIFHTVLFSNDYWIMTPKDLSFYLFSDMFFLRSMIVIVLIMIIINTITYRITTKKISKIKSKKH